MIENDDDYSPDYTFNTVSDDEILRTPKYYELVEGDQDKQFEEYSNNYYNGSVCYDQSCYIGGKSAKRFVRYNSEELAHLSAAITSGNSSYVTYLNDLILEMYKSGLNHLPVKSVGCLRKVFSIPQFAKNEEICSRIANIFGLPTVYNHVVNKFDYTGDALEVLSVDFLKDEETLVPLNELGLKSFPAKLKSGPQVYELCDCVEKLKKALTRKLILFPNRKNDVNNIIRQFIKSYFIKYVIMSDCDFAPRNFGIVINKAKKSATFAPNFDYEYCLDRLNNCTDYNFRIIDNAIKYVAENYPEVLTEIKQMINNAIKGNQLSRLSEKYEFVPYCNSDNIKTIVQNRSLEVLDHINSYQLSQEEVKV